MLRQFILQNNLKSYRKAQKLTQTQLAQYVGCTKNTISSIETGVFIPSAYLSKLLCNALDCKFEDLFYLDVISGKPNNEYILEE